MPIPPKPYTLKCYVCSWHKTIAPRSDVLFSHEYPETCPKCGSELHAQAADLLSAQLAMLKRHLGF